MGMSVVDHLPPTGYHLSQSRRNSGINERELIPDIEHIKVLIKRPFEKCLIFQTVKRSWLSDRDPIKTADNKFNGRQ